MNHAEAKAWADKIVAFWLEINIKLEPGATAAQIAAAETTLGIAFPLTFVELYKKANGANNWDWTKDMFSIWPLERMIEELNRGTANNFVGFCDYLINSHAIGFYRDREGVFIENDTFKPITLTFEEAVELINDGSDLVY